MEDGTVSALEHVLRWGPVGLAGVMLALVIVAIIVGRFKPANMWFLSMFLVVSGLCFATALAAMFAEPRNEQRLAVTITPDGSEVEAVPAPRILLDGVAVDPSGGIQVSPESVLLIDASAAYDHFHEAAAKVTMAEARAAFAEAQLARVADALDAALIENEAHKEGMESYQTEVALVRERTEALSTEIAALQQRVRSRNTTSSPATRQRVQEVEREVEQLRERQENFGTGIFR